jgi:hypothetical protein
LTAVASLTLLLVALGIVGAFVARSTTLARIFYWWLGPMVIFMIVVGYGNRHPWYQLPFVPIAAAFAGAACVYIAGKIRARQMRIILSILLVAGFAALAFHYTLSFYRSSGGALRTAGLFLKQTTPPGSLIVAADIGDPTIFYYAERKGWHFPEKDGIYDGEPNDAEQAITDLEALRKTGARYLVLTSNTTWWLEWYPVFRQHLDGIATLMESTPEFRIYNLNEEKE